MATKLFQDQQKAAFESLKGDLGMVNIMQTPKVERVVVAVGVGKVAKEKGKLELIADRLAKITGQKAVTRGAKKAIATFKTRIGDPVGYQVTLRGKRAEDFINRLINVALPRAKDFKGLSDKAIDEMGNFTIGIKEHTIFPETTDEELKDVFGIGITVVTTAHNKKDARAYLAHLGFPFKKVEEKK